MRCLDFWQACSSSEKSLAVNVQVETNIYWTKPIAFSFHFKCQKKKAVNAKIHEVFGLTRLVVELQSYRLQNGRSNIVPSRRLCAV